ncbi:MAG TPA: encapsulin-associated ferritin-like protein [Acidimicrobiales bacterium]|nr:encapsulin-associated ferritin-like protein [Acidimicrobiales bacterium]
MPDNSATLHEDPTVIGPAVIDRHRAVASIMEELEAVDWYDQRVSATSDPSLAEVLAHNRDEEKEHAAMTLEWLRRQDPVLDAALRRYLFTEGSIVAIEGGADGDGDGGSGDPGGPDDGGPGSLGIGSLRTGKDAL